MINIDELSEGDVISVRTFMDPDAVITGTFQDKGEQRRDIFILREGYNDIPGYELLDRCTGWIIREKEIKELKRLA